MYGEGAMDVIMGTLRVGMGCGTEAEEGMLREGWGRVPGGTACPHSAVAEALAQGRFPLTAVAAGGTT